MGETVDKWFMWFITRAIYPKVLCSKCKVIQVQKRIRMVWLKKTRVQRAFNYVQLNVPHMWMINGRIINWWDPYLNIFILVKGIYWQNNSSNPNVKISFLPTKGLNYNCYVWTKQGLKEEGVERSILVFHICMPKCPWARSSTPKCPS